MALSKCQHSSNTTSTGVEQEVKKKGRRTKLATTMSDGPDRLHDDLAQFYLVVDLVLQLFTGHRHTPPRIRIEFLAKGGRQPRAREETWPTLVIDLKENIRDDPLKFMADFDQRVAEHVMRGRRPDRLAFYIHEPDPRRGERRPQSYWMAATNTVGNFPVERAFGHTKRQYTDHAR